MTPQRIAVKFFVSPDPGAAVDVEPFIGVFHRFIQQGALEGLLLDVADYAHVPEGPGVLLVGHDVDYAIDQTAGRTGLLTTRKRFGDLPLSEVVRDLLRKSLIAIQAIEQDEKANLRFATDVVTIQYLDRLATPNTADGFEAARRDIAPVFEKLFDGGCELSRAHGDDPRKPLSVSVTAKEVVAADALLQKLGGPAARTVARAPVQTDWDIEVDDLKALRDGGSDFVLVDVRETGEYETCNLGGQLIPLSSLPARIGELDSGAHVVVHCRTGARSSRAVKLLREAGFENAWNLRGGILAWIDRIDPTLTRY